jgi:hypothetical protein
MMYTELASLVKSTCNSHRVKSHIGLRFRSLDTSVRLCHLYLVISVLAKNELKQWTKVWLDLLMITFFSTLSQFQKSNFQLMIHLIHENSINFLIFVKLKLLFLFTNVYPTDFWWETSSRSKQKQKNSQHIILNFD